MKLTLSLSELLLLVALAALSGFSLLTSAEILIVLEETFGTRMGSHLPLIGCGAAAALCSAATSRRRARSDFRTPG